MTTDSTNNDDTQYQAVRVIRDGEPDLKLVAAYTVKENADGHFVLVAPNGNFARTTASDMFTTDDRAKADEAADFINQDTTGGKKRVGAHWLKSTFGVF